MYRNEVAVNANNEYKKDIYKEEYYLYGELITHKRATYDLVGVLGDMGGI